MGSINKYKNNEMVDYLIRVDRIRTKLASQILRAVDRGDYVTPEARNQAYLQQPWRKNQLHLSAPCIYGEVLEGLQLKTGQSFLNIGSGTGYFSTCVGLIIGCSGVNHGIEVYPEVVDYANERLEDFIENSPALDVFDFCAPKFHVGNGLCLGSDQQPYDRIYCGAECPEEFLPYLKRLLKVGGLLVLPVGNSLLKIKRMSIDKWASKNLLSVSFASLQLPTSKETADRFIIEWTSPPRLQILSYAVVRRRMKASLKTRRSPVFAPLLRCPRLTDYDINELLRCILSTDQNRESPLPLSGFPLHKQQKCSDEVVHINSCQSELNGRKFPSTSHVEKKPPSVTQSNKELDKFPGVEERKNPLLPLLPFLPKPIVQQIKKPSPAPRPYPPMQSIDSNFKTSTPVRISNKEERVSTSELPKFLADLDLNLEVTKSLITSKNRTEMSNNESKSKKTTDITTCKKDLRSDIQQNMPPSNSLQETKKSNIISNNIPNDKNERLETENNTKSPPPSTSQIPLVPLLAGLRLDAKDKLKEQESGLKKAFNFTVPSQDTPLFTQVGPNTYKSPEKINSKKHTEENSASKSKEADNITGSPVFRFGENKKDSSLSSNWSLSPLNKTTENKVSPKSSPDNPLGTNIKESVESPNSVPKHRPTNVVPADGHTSSSNICGKDFKLSIFMNQGVMEVHLPFEQKESTNIIFSKNDDKAFENKTALQHLNTVESKSTSSDKTQIAKSIDTYKSNIFSLLDTALSSIALTKEMPPATIPISFKRLNYFTDWLWDCMRVVAPDPLEGKDKKLLKAIFQKGALLLAEAKIAYAQRTLPQQPKKGLSSRDVFTNEELTNLKSMSARVPLPLAVYLECIGNTSMLGQVVTPVLVEHPDHTALSGAPSHMIKLFHSLRFDGVPLNGPIHQQCLELGLPMLDFVDFTSTFFGRRLHGDSEMVKITEQSFNFWSSYRGRFAVKWDEDDCNTFKKIISSLESKKGFNVDLDISHGIGSQAQFVETTDYKVDRPTRWFTSFPVDDNSIKLGATFSFLCKQNSTENNVEFTKYMEGEITPRSIMFAILSSVYMTQFKKSFVFEEVEAVPAIPYHILRKLKK